MLFVTKGKKINPSVPIKIGDEIINRVHETKFFGIIIDDKLNWSYHIAKVKNKISKGLGILWKVKRLINETTMLTLYYSFIYPYLHYGIMAWGKADATYLDSLFKLQKRAVRLVSSAKRLAHTKPLFKKLKLLKLSDIYILNIMLFMFKFRHSLLPQVFDGMFVLNRDVHNYFTRQFDMYHYLTWRLQMRKKSIRIQGPIIWNQLVLHFDYNCTIVTFKFHVKNYLLVNDIEI